MAKQLFWLFATCSVLAVLFDVFTRQPEELARVRADLATVSAERDSILAAVRQRDHEHDSLQSERDARAAEAALLRDSVDVLERSRADAQLNMRQVRTVGGLQDELRGAFPELGPDRWGLTTLPLDDQDTLGLEYLLVPAWFAETFVIDHANAESWREQRDRLLAVDPLRVVVSALQDSVLSLEAANRAAFQGGYQRGYAAYTDLSQRYQAELKRPRFSLRSAVGLLAAAAGGFAAGWVAR